MGGVSLMADAGEIQFIGNCWGLESDKWGIIADPGGAGIRTDSTVSVSTPEPFHRRKREPRPWATPTPACDVIRPL